MKPNLFETLRHNRLGVICAIGLFTTSLISCSSIFIYAEDVLLKNRQNLNRLNIGMNKDEVLEVMGQQTIRITGGPVVNSPYRVETMRDINDKPMEIMLFYTDEKHDPATISDDELTPVVLKDGKVEGWGRTYLSDVAPSYRYRHPY